MKIHTRTLLILGITIFVMVVVINLFAQYFILASYGYVERGEAQVNTERVAAAIGFDREKLAGNVQDWSVWDDTYDFMGDTNPGYYASNLEATTSFTSLAVDGIFLFNTSGHPVSADWYDRETRTKQAIPASLKDYFARHRELFIGVPDDAITQGFISLPDGLYLVAMHQILDNDFGGPSRGTFVMVRAYDAVRIHELEDRVHLPVRMVPLPPQGGPDDPAVRELTAPGAAPISLRSANESVNTASSLLYDIEGKPAILLQVEVPRTAHSQAVTTLIFMAGGFLIVGIFYVLMTELLFRRYIVQPLTDLDTQVLAVGKNHDPSARLAVQGDDEIASLATSFNRMLEDLAGYQAQLASQADALGEANRKANMYLNIYLDVVTYEILNALNSLDGYAELIRMQGGEQEQDYAGRMIQILNRNRAVIRNIEMISTIYKNPPLRDRISLSSIISREIGDFPGTQVSCEGCDITVLADEKLGIVFHNILANAVSFGGPGAAVGITARDLPGGLIEISVTDTGPGIPDAAKPGIFDRFMQNTTSRSSYGLGLHIVKMLVEAYGGTIRADDRVPGHPEQGAAIRFTLKKG